MCVLGGLHPAGTLYSQVRPVMTVYRDLTKYSHMVEPYEFDNVLNVGWIDPRGSFPIGVVSAPIKEALLNIAFGRFAAKPVVEPNRAPPVCPACGGAVRIEREGRILTDSELWIPAEGKTYASPILVIHYIEAHNYLPPQEFLDAIANLRCDYIFDGEALYREKLKECGWFGNQFKA